MTSRGISRRGFIGGTAGAGVVLVIGADGDAGAGDPGRALRRDWRPQPDANGLLLPDGFTSRVIARAGEVVEGTGYEWPAFPDGAATFPIEDDGGWYHVVNSEIPVEGDGGASAIRFDADGNVVDAYRVLGGTSQNCAGGPTPWGTWLSCEEFDGGLVWECDPARPDSGTALPAMGAFHHEAAAVDPDNEVVYLTEDEPDGAFYRFTPTAYPDLSEGVARGRRRSIDGRRASSWTRCPTRPGAHGADRAPGPPRSPRSTAARAAGTPTASCTSRPRATTRSAPSTRPPTPDRRLRRQRAARRRRQHHRRAGSGDLYVAEDGDDMQVVRHHAPRATSCPVAQIVGEALPPNAAPSEITGPVFSPDGTRLYFSSQRGGNPQTGITYEVTGPFRGAGQEPAATTTTVAAADHRPGRVSDRHRADADDDDGSSPAVPIGIGVGAVVAVAAGAVALRRRGAPT